MEQEFVPSFQILDIIQLDREEYYLQTENKSCVVLSCRLRGESLFFYNDRSHRVCPGQVLYVPAGASYAQQCQSEQVICFHLKASGKLSEHIQVIQCENADLICDLFAQAYQVWKRKEENYIYLCLSILYRIIALSGAGISETQRKQHPLLSGAMEYLQEHLYEENLTLEQVFEKSHISRTYFNRLFYADFGCTPVAYINRCRIDRAKQFLRNGSYTNAEIARLCGFANLKYFYVVFKKITAMTTTQYRKSIN